jgi:hypothetical protein
VNVLLSTTHNFLFIATPKTATSSIEDALESYHDPLRAPELGKHALAMEAVDVLGEQALASLYKFAFVRNPYSWMYSWYRFRRRSNLASPKHRHHSRYAGNMSFDEFMQSYNEGQIFMKQSDFIYSHDGELLVDFVGRYESLQADFEHVCNTVGIASPPLLKVNTSIGVEFSSDLMSAESRQIINQDFERDFKLFGYDTLT